MKKNILIFGGTGDLGKKILNFFFRQKYNIIFSSTSENKIKKTQESYLNSQKILIGKICDFRKENDIRNIINFSFNKFKSINIIINCVGIFEYDNFQNLNYDKMCDTFKINSYSLVAINKFLNKHKRRTDLLKVISIGSSSSYIGSKNTIAYSGSKHALQGIIKSLNQTYYKRHTINYSINPGTLNNKMGKKIKNINNQNLIEQDEIIKTISYLISLDRVGVPEDIYLRRFKY
jgi:3-oxoacyl-[acyl-carrier protein] reductase